MMYVEKKGVGTSLKTERSSVERGKVINEGWKLDLDLEKKACR